MIANITTIMYILSVFDESINNGILQKGTAISRIDDEDAFQIYKYYNYLTSQNDTDPDLNDEYEVKSPLKVENVYLITGKFSTAQDNSINVSITTNVHLSIEKEDIPIIKPTVHLLRKTFGICRINRKWI
jgi:PDZ domain-containing secreted protein